MRGPGALSASARYSKVDDDGPHWRWLLAAGVSSVEQVCRLTMSAATWLLVVLKRVLVSLKGGFVDGADTSIQLIF